MPQLKEYTDTKNILQVQHTRLQTVTPCALGSCLTRLPLYPVSCATPNYSLTFSWSTCSNKGKRSSFKFWFTDVPGRQPCGGRWHGRQSTPTATINLGIGTSKSREWFL